MNYTASRFGAARRTVKTYSPLIGFCFLINSIVGTGFLGIPYVVWHVGIIAGMFLLMVVSFFITFPALWTLEVMARAQAVESKMVSIQESSAVDCPRFQISTVRRFEVRELCSIFLGKRVGYLYLAIVVFYLWLALWLTAPVAGSAWSTLLPMKFHMFEQCTQQDFIGRYHPEGGCWKSYALCVIFFGVIVVPISCLDIKEQELFQVFMSVLRFVLIGGLIIYSLIAEASDFHPGTSLNDSDSMSELGIPWTKFNLYGLLAALPVIVYAQILHISIPTIVQPISDKSKLARLMFFVFATTTVLYGLLGLTIAVHQKDRINEVCTLNWMSHTSNKSTTLRIIAYFIVLFPSIDVCSVYPLVVMVLANIVEYLLTGDASITPNRVTRTIHRLFWSLTPLVGAFYLSNIVELDKYAGSLAFFIAFWFPAALQYKSKQICDKVFGHSKTPYSSWYSTTQFILVIFTVGVVVTIVTMVGFILPGNVS